jgi:hypothetical protein
VTKSTGSGPSTREGRDCELTEEDCAIVFEKKEELDTGATILETGWNK